MSGTCFAELGNTVTCVDVDEAKIAGLRAGQLPIFEPELEDLCARNAREGRLHFTTELTQAVPAADAIFLALPTPPGENGSADLSYVLGVADALGPLLSGYTVIVDKSTVPVGTSEQVRTRIATGIVAGAPEHAPEFDVVSNPEFLREGFAIHDFMAPDRIVIGTSSSRAEVVMRELYEPLTRQNHPLLCMDERSAELTKYAANSFLAMKITFMNEIANLCERLGADADAIRLGIGSDERIGSRFLFPGIGYGGSCFPKDVQALQHTASQYDYSFDLLSTIMASNVQQQQVLTRKVQAYFGDDMHGKTIALWGLAFKANTDDIRESPPIGMVRDLLAAGAKVRAYDPEAMPNVRRQLGQLDGLVLADNELAVLEGADALCIATEWPQFSAVPLAKIKQHLRTPVVFDGRNIFQLQHMRDAGFYYESIGRPIVGERPATPARS